MRSSNNRWKILLWLTVVFILLLPLARLRFPAWTWTTALGLPLAIAWATLDWRQELRGRPNRNLMAGVALIWVPLAFLVFYFSTGLTDIFSSDVLRPAALLVQYGLLALQGSLALVLLCWRSGYGGRWTWAALSGATAGSLLVVVLAYPLTSSLLRMTTPFPLADTGYNFLQIILVLLAAGLALATGPAAARLSGATSAGERFAAGALAGSTAGLLFFGLFGGAAAVMVANRPLMAMAVSQAGLQEEAWLPELAEAINLTFPLIFLAFWLCLLGPALVSGLAALLPLPGGHRPAGPETLSVWPIVLLLTAFPWVLFILIGNISIFTLLADPLDQVLVEYGRSAGWQSTFNLLLTLVHPLLTLIGLQLGGLFWLWEMGRAGKLRRPAGCLGHLAGWMGLAVVTFLYLLTPGFWPYSFFTLFLSLGLVGLAIWLRRSSPATPEEPIRPPPSLSWITAGAAGGVLAAVLLYQTLAIVLTTVLLDVAMVEELSREAAPPPGLPWLADIVNNYVDTQSQIFLAALGLGMLVGGLSGWFLRRLTPDLSN